MRNILPLSPEIGNRAVGGDGGESVIARASTLNKRAKGERLSLIKERYQRLIMRQRQEIEREIQDDFKQEEEEAFKPEVETAASPEPYE